MKLERIISIKGGRVQTQNGFFNVMGNASMTAGSILPGFNGHVIARVNPYGRRPEWAAGANPAEEEKTADSFIIAYQNGTYDLFDSSTLEITNDEPIAFANWPTEWIKTMQNNGSYLSNYYFANNGKYVGLLIVARGSGDTDTYYCFDLTSSAKQPIFQVEAGCRSNYHGFYFEITNTGVPCFGGMNEVWSVDGTTLYSENCIGGTLSSQPAPIDSQYKELAASKIADQSGWADQNRHIIPEYWSEYVRDEYGGIKLHEYWTGYRPKSVELARPAAVETIVTDEGIDPDGYDAYSFLVAGNPKTGNFIADITWIGSRHFTFNTQVSEGLFKYLLTDGKINYRFVTPRCIQKYCPVNPSQYILSPASFEFPQGLSGEEWEAAKEQGDAALAQNQYNPHLIPYSDLENITDARNNQMGLAVTMTWYSGSTQYGWIGLYRYEQTSIDENNNPVMGWVSNGYSSGAGYATPYDGKSHIGPYTGGEGWVSPFPYCLNTGFSHPENKVYDTDNLPLYWSIPNSYATEQDYLEYAPYYTNSFTMSELLVTNGVYASNVNNSSDLSLISQSLKNTIRGWETYYPKHLEFEGEAWTRTDENGNVTGLFQDASEYVTYGCLYYGDEPTGSGGGNRSITKEEEGGASVVFQLPQSTSSGSTSLSIQCSNYKDGFTTYIGNKVSPIDYSSSAYAPYICFEKISSSIIVLGAGQLFKESTTGFDWARSVRGSAINTVLRLANSSVL